jgi:hypothetical protein
MEETTYLITSLLYIYILLQRDNGLKFYEGLPGQDDPSATATATATATNLKLL